MTKTAATTSGPRTPTAPACPESRTHRKLAEILDEFSRPDARHPYSKSFSYGLVGLPAGHAAVNPDDLLHQADKAMYLQKKQHHREKS